jgi:hypothetical protein
VGPFCGIDVTQQLEDALADPPADGQVRLARTVRSTDR